MQLETHALPVKTFLLMFLLLAAALIFSYFITHAAPITSFLSVLSLAIIVLTFVNVSVGLGFLLISALYSLEIPFFSTLARAGTIRFDDILILIIFITWFAKSAITKSGNIFPHTPLNGAIIFYSLICMVSTARGIFLGILHPLTSISFLIKYMEYFFLFFIVFNNIKSEKQVKIFIIIMIAVMFLVAISGYFQIRLKRVEGPVPRPESVGEDANTVASYYVMMYGLIFGLLVYAKSWILKIVLFIQTILMMPPFLFTLSRGSYVGFIAMFLTLLFLAKGRRTILILMLFFIVFAAINYLPTEIIERIKYTYTPSPYTIAYNVFGTTIHLEESTTGRIEVYKDVVRKVSKYPLFGCGVARSSVVDTQYGRVLLEIGIVGSVIFIFLIVKVYKLALNRRKWAYGMDIWWMKGITVGFVASFAGLLVHGISASTFILIRPMIIFWFIAAIITVMPQIVQSKEENQ